MMSSKTTATNPMDTTHMAIVKASYTKSLGGAKASLRYIQHRPGRVGERLTRELYGAEGTLTREAAYRMIDEQAKRSVFFRLVLSPDPLTEDTHKDLSLQELIRHTMLTLEERMATPVPYVAATHDDHAPHRHVHILACVQGRLNTKDLAALRESATDAARQQRRERDVLREHQQEQQEGVGVALAR